MNNIYLLFLSFFIKLILLKYNKDYYLINFILTFSITYLYSSDYKISFAIALLYLIITTLFKYTFEKKSKIINTFIFFIIIILIKNIIKLVKPFTELINFICLSYLLFSVFEWLTHKYIMHCDKKSFVYNLLSRIDHTKIIESTCDKHIEHHKEVKPDMNLLKVSYKESLFMGWSIFIYIFIFGLITFISSNYVTGSNFNIYYLILFSFLFTIIWCYLWNKLHPIMHNYSGEYSIKEGPYENVIDLSFINKLFYKNHKNHHLQKGTDKGNYNVIIMGADEWFGSNITKINNTNYCKNPEVANEEICKNI